MSRSARAPAQIYAALCVLVLAWVCANSPQMLTFHVVSWIGGARHFSHQERLRADVVAILTRTTTNSEARAERWSDAIASKPQVPMTAAEATVRQMYLGLVADTLSDLDSNSRASASISHSCFNVIPPVSPMRELPAEPPRAVV